jgi:hypothetical protein
MKPALCLHRNIERSRNLRGADRCARMSGALRPQYGFDTRPR